MCQTLCCQQIIAHRRCCYHYHHHHPKVTDWVYMWGSAWLQRFCFFLLLLPSSPVPNFLAPKFTSLCFSHCAICPCLRSGLKLRHSSFPVPLSYWPLLCHWLNSFRWLDRLCNNLDNFFWLLPSSCLLWKGFLSSCLCQQHCLNETRVATEGVVLVFWGHRSLCESEEIYRPSQKKKKMHKTNTSPAFFMKHFSWSPPRDPS